MLMLFPVPFPVLMPINTISCFPPLYRLPFPTLTNAVPFPLLMPFPTLSSKQIFKQNILYLYCSFTVNSPVKIITELLEPVRHNIFCCLLLTFLQECTGCTMTLTLQLHPHGQD